MTEILSPTRAAIKGSLQDIERLFRQAEERAQRENERGGDARDVVALIGTLVGVDLAEDVIDGDRWSRANMVRVYKAVQQLVEHEELRLSLAGVQLSTEIVSFVGADVLLDTLIARQRRRSDYARVEDVL